MLWEAVFDLVGRGGAWCRFLFTNSFRDLDIAAACSDCARCSRVWCGSAGARVNGCSGRGEILERLFLVCADVIMVVGAENGRSGGDSQEGCEW
jgi:hypothetical protein